jgi:hypothetical protein
VEIIYSFNLKEGMSTAYAEHVTKNEQVLRERAPEGWTYLGTFFTVHGLGDYDAQQRWGLADYANLGTAWGHDEVWDRVLVESMAFVDGSARATVVKSTDEVGILE